MQGVKSAKVRVLSDFYSVYYSFGEMSDSGKKAWSRKRRQQETAARMREKKRSCAQNRSPSPGTSLTDQQQQDPQVDYSVVGSSAQDSDHDSNSTVPSSSGVVVPIDPGPISPQSLAWKGKRRSWEKAKHMRQSKRPVSAQSSCLEDLSVRDPDYAYRSEEECDQGSNSSDEEFNSEEALDDWMLTLRLDQRRMLGVNLMESFKRRQKMNVKDAAKEAGSIVGLSEKTVRKYRNDFFTNKGSLTPLKQGKYERHCVYIGK